MLPTLCLCLCSLCEARQGWLTSVMLTTGQCRCPYEASNVRGVGWGWDIAFLGVYHFEPHFEVFKEKLRYQRTVRAFKKTSIRCLNVWSGKEEGRQTIYHLLFKFISLSLSLSFTDWVYLLSNNCVAFCGKMAAAAAKPFFLPSA